MELDDELEFYQCKNCGSSGGGACFWELVDHGEYIETCAYT